jgi:hypothetical protein
VRSECGPSAVTRAITSFAGYLRLWRRPATRGSPRRLYEGDRLPRRRSSEHKRQPGGSPSFPGPHPGADHPPRGQKAGFTGATPPHWSRLRVAGRPLPTARYQAGQDRRAPRAQGRKPEQSRLLVPRPTVSLPSQGQWTKSSTMLVRVRNPSSVESTSPGTSRRWSARGRTSDAAPRAAATASWCPGS